MGNWFTDKTKFKKLDSDLTITWLSNLQSHLRKLKNNNEITEADFKAISPQNTRPAKAPGLPKIHKEFDNLPSFRPITDTTGSAHYLTAKFLANLLKPLTTYQITFDNLFDVARKTKTFLKSYWIVIINRCSSMLCHYSQMYHYVKLLILLWKEYIRIDLSKLI